MTNDDKMLAYLIEKRRALMTELKAIEALIESMKHGAPTEHQAFKPRETK